ncbi:MAG: hypothetical protein A2283_02375 [Lentisphaerae bacterium RIFOXYA12_FULL_48_11]|nr:MAG: hypothetical protein A2283_02375 [Lentisphaerae bacterium RIFOXYA12_FULL_48_11]
MSEKLADYCLVSEHDKAKFEQEVKRLMTQGWIPHGSVSVVAPVVDGAPVSLFSQAMVKEKKPYIVP